MGKPGQKGRLPYLQNQRSKRGTIFWYVRRDRGRRIRIRGEFGSKGFLAEYAAALAALSGAPPKQSSCGKMGELIQRYRSSFEYSTLAKTTRYQREFHLKRLNEAIGAVEYATISTGEIQQNFDSRRSKPSQARHWLDTMKALFRYAKRNELVKRDPTEGVEARIVGRKKSNGFAAWTEDDVQKFESRWQRGTRERLMFDILLHTGLRRGDANRLGPAHINDGVLSIVTEKTQTEVTMRVLDQLQATLEAGPTGSVTFIATEKGLRMTKESFGNAFRRAAKQAGVDKPMHGLRKAAANRAAHAGMTSSELQALFGWTDHKMASHYTKNAERKSLGMAASKKLAAASLS